MSKLLTRPKPVVLVILDGFGIAPPYPGNAVANANLLLFNRLMKAYPHCLLHSSGSAVGLPHGVMGNSEVGHMNLGAGTIVFQTLPRINTAITNGSFYENNRVLEAIEHCKANGSNFHIMGCTSTGNIHSTTEHLYAILQMIQKAKFDGNRVFIHCFTDGRDTPPDSGKVFLEQIDNECKRRGIGRIASIIGRYFSMDRNSKWDRIQKAYDLMTKGVGTVFGNPVQAMESWYAKGVTDEFIEPTLIADSNGNTVTINDNDALFFFNYRSDRAMQITKAFIDPEFNLFDRKLLQNFFYLGMTQYDRKLNGYMHLAFDPENVSIPIGRVVAENGLRQLRMAETEKFAHVTFFINGGRDLIFDNEDRVLVPSPKVATYDLKPEMSTYELAQVFVNKLKLRIYDFIVINIAAPDMVGHTGNLEATIKALQATDRNLDKIILNTIAYGGAVVVTADHGNCEVMVDYETGRPHTEHTTNPVPFIYIGPGAKPVELPLGVLSDVTPTLLHLMKLPIPSTMTRNNLLEGII
jgi:2,3-bisphosphoglycerate-independent phosphoglycerate mutase